MRATVLTILIVLGVFISKAQDIHFSQYYAAPLNLNPATTGNFSGKFRIGVNSKHQWSAVSVPYKTISAYCDGPLLKKKYKQDAWGYGILVNTDIAGDSKFATIGAGFAISYSRSLTRNNDHFISIGIMPGIIQHSIDFDALYYDNQYNGNYFDPDLPHNENLGKKSWLSFDLSAGVQYMYNFKKNKSFNVGFSVSHLTRPSLALNSNPTIRTNIKYNLYSGAKFPLSNAIDAYPMALVSLQGNYMELIFGSLIKYNRNRHYIDQTSLNFGLFYRYNDAIVVTSGFDISNVNFGVSYDINLSKLRAASQIRGGLEFSIAYVFGKNKSKRVREISCPIF